MSFVVASAFLPPKLQLGEYHWSYLARRFEAIFTQSTGLTFSIRAKNPSASVG